ncbi:MAG TPA: hypothetical protein VFS40_11295 [Gemmatimonadales bacterium]|nr:hypothetical protein [Gemmatimonadales bacterium]
MLAGVGVLAVLALVLWLGRRETQTLATVAGGTAAAPFAAGGADDGGAPGGAPPDISAMSPRERFDRLYNRVMTAAEKGDQATAERFMPMALMAYGQLDSVDGDARFHAALLQLHSGNVAAGRALADTMLREQPGDLLGYVLLANAARWSKDEAGLRKVYGDFLAHYDAEMKAGRPEYKAHERTIAELRQAALDDRSK